MAGRDWLDEVLALSIHWVVDAQKDCYLRPLDGPPELRLRMNNFPDEPMYSLLFPGGQLDLDDLPAAWTRTDDLQWPSTAAAKDPGRSWWDD